MTTQKSGAQISTKAFVQSVLILLVLMIVAGVLTKVIPSGAFDYIEEGGITVIDPVSFHYTDTPNYPIWRWFTAPFETLWGPDALIIIVIIVFIVLVSGAFAVMDKANIINMGLANLIQKFGGNKYTLLLVISFFFMCLGAFFGILEEIIPLIPIMVALSYSLGWDALVGLGMSVLAANMGFSAAITNPFTIGVAQSMAGLPAFSGAWFRLPFFVLTFAIFGIFITKYAKKIDKNTKLSLTYVNDAEERKKYQDFSVDELKKNDPKMKRAVIFFSAFLVLILILLTTGEFIPFIAESGIMMPLVGLLFFVGGLGAGLLTSTPKKDLWKALGEGILGFLPGILLILMAGAIKIIITNGGVIDTILFKLTSSLDGTQPTFAAMVIYVLTLIMEFFIGSAGAKAVLLMPIVLPIADIVGVTRQIAVTAYCFGDGFSNMIYPTNPALLICLGLGGISYGKWFRWTAKIWLPIIALSILFLWLGTLINLGPF